MTFVVRIACQCALVTCVALAAVACDGGQTPTHPGVIAVAPSPAPGPVREPPPGAPLSVLGIPEINLDGQRAIDLAPTIRLVETGGHSAAVVTAITFNLADGVPWPTPMQCRYGQGTWVPAGGEATIVAPKDAYGEYFWSFSVPVAYEGRLAVSIGYADEEGRTGAVSTAVTLPWVR